MSFLSDSDDSPKKKRKKFDKTKMPQINWNENRVRPEFTPGIWQDEEEYELTRYVDWHRRHPNCVTPRDRDGPTAGTKMIGAIYEDEENPNMIYSKTPNKPLAFLPEFQPTKLGVDCTTEEVSVIAMKSEYNKVISYKTEYDDPWYEMSVKDHLEQSHIDGSHTTVKTKRSARPVMTEFDRNLAWQREQYGSYNGGYPSISTEHAKNLEELALKDKFLLFDAKPKVKVSPFDREYVFSKYTANGTALDDYNKENRNKKVTNAVTLFEQESTADAAIAEKITRDSSSRGKSSRSKKKRSNKVVPVTEDPDVVMREKLGGDKATEKLTRKFIKLAIKVTKKAKINKNIIDTSMNLVEACEKLRVVKVLSMLASGAAATPNMKTPEDEPLFTHLINMAIKMDNITGNLHPPGVMNNNNTAASTSISKSNSVGNGPTNGRTGTAGSCENMRVPGSPGSKTGPAGVSVSAKPSTSTKAKDGYFTAMANKLSGPPSIQDTADRKKLQRILTILVQYDVNVNVTNRDGYTALHMAAKNDNSKLVAWLVQQPKIDIDKVSKQEHMNALMFGAKYGSVRVMAELIRAGLKENATNNFGMTALHYAGQYGQSRPAQFLLRIGCNKKLRNEEDKLAAELAAENGFQATAQLISAFASTDDRAAAEQIEYLIRVEFEKDLSHHTISSILKSVFSLHNIGNGMSSLASYFKHKAIRLYHKVRYQLGIDETEPLDEEEEKMQFAEDENDDEGGAETGDNHRLSSQGSGGGSGDGIASRLGEEKDNCFDNSADNSFSNIGEVLPF